MASEKGFSTSDGDSTAKLFIFSSEFSEGIVIAFERWSLSCSLSTAAFISCSFSGVSSSSFLLLPTVNNCEGKSCLFSEDSTYTHTHTFMILTSIEIFFLFLMLFSSKSAMFE